MSETTTPSGADSPVTFVNVFEIPEDEIDTFVDEWRERSRFMTRAEGFISAELLRAPDADTDFKLINVTRWASREAFEKATHATDYRADLDRYKAESHWVAHRGFYETAAVASGS